MAARENISFSQAPAENLQGRWGRDIRPHLTSSSFSLRMAAYIIGEPFEKVRGLVAVRRCYAQGGGDCYARL
jgi:hypothetical protein